MSSRDIPADAVGLRLRRVGVGGLHVEAVDRDAVGDVVVWVPLRLLVVVHVGGYLALHPHEAVIAQVLLRSLAYLPHGRQRRGMPSRAHFDFCD